MSSQAELERLISETLIDEERLSRRIAELGEEISADYAGHDLLHLRQMERIAAAPA